MEKSADAFRTISEVAEALDTPAHVLRFWESRFPQIQPLKRAGGRRYYRPFDMALLEAIRRLLHDEGLTIRGVQKLLEDQGVAAFVGMEEPSNTVTPLEPRPAMTVRVKRKILRPASLSEQTQDGSSLGEQTQDESSLGAQTQDASSLSAQDPSAFDAQIPSGAELSEGPEPLRANTAVEAESPRAADPSEASLAQFDAEPSETRAQDGAAQTPIESMIARLGAQPAAPLSEAEPLEAPFLEVTPEIAAELAAEFAEAPFVEAELPAPAQAQVLPFLPAETREETRRETLRARARARARLMPPDDAQPDLFANIFAPDEEGAEVIERDTEAAAAQAAPAPAPQAAEPQSDEPQSDEPQPSEQPVEAETAPPSKTEAQGDPVETAATDVRPNDADPAPMSAAQSELRALTQALKARLAETSDGSRTETGSRAEAGAITEAERTIVRAALARAINTHQSLVRSVE